MRVNYDSGNSASLGYRPRDEFAAYGSRVGSVHLKDRRLGAGTAPLGRGTPISQSCSPSSIRIATVEISFCRWRGVPRATNCNGRGAMHRERAK